MGPVSGHWRQKHVLFTHSPRILGDCSDFTCRVRKHFYTAAIQVGPTGALSLYSLPVERQRGSNVDDSRGSRVGTLSWPPRRIEGLEPRYTRERDRAPLLNHASPSRILKSFCGPSARRKTAGSTVFALSPPSFPYNAPRRPDHART